MLDRGEKGKLDRLSRDDRILRLRALIEQEIGVRLQPREVSRRHRSGAGLGGGARVMRHETPRPALEDPETRVGGDAVEPGAEGGLAPVRSTPIPCSEE